MIPVAVRHPSLPVAHGRAGRQHLWSAVRRLGAWPRHHPSAAVGWLSFAVYLALAYLLAIQKHAFIGDALSRMANTYYVLYSRDPHLGAIGFVWTPLQNLIEIPLYPLLRPFGLILLAGGITSAAGGALNIVLIRRILHLMGVSGWRSWGMVALYGLNPWIVLYAASGMTETLFITTELALIAAMMAWSVDRGHAPLLAAGMACAAAFGLRYESAALLAAGIVAIGVVWWIRDRRRVDRLEGEVLAFITPSAYGLSLWMLANWLMEGSPLYFLTGPGSASYTAKLHRQEFAQSPHAFLALMYHHPLPVLREVSLRCLEYMPAVGIFVVAALVIYGYRRRFDLLVPLLFAPAVLGFNAYALYSGTSEGWFRYYYDSLILGFVAGGLVLSAIVQSTRLRGIPSGTLSLGVLALAALSLPSVWLAMWSPATKSDERAMLQALFTPKASTSATRAWAPDRAMAIYLDRLHLPRASVVVDTTTGFGVVLFSHHPDQFIIPSDFDFQSTFAQLQGFQGYILVSTRTATTSALIQAHYPGLLTNTVPWAHLQKRIGPWLLYRTE